MEKHAFRMKLRAGCEDEYRRRHDQIWPELKTLLKEAGISDYSIYLDRESGSLFAVLWRKADHGMAELPAHPVMQRWWAQMADIMHTRDHDEPIVEPLVPMFHLP